MSDTPAKLADWRKDKTTRILAITAGVNMFGTGLFITISVVYLTSIVGLSPERVALGLAIAGFFGLLANIPFGYLADVFGARVILMYVNVALGIVTAGYAWVHSFIPFVLLASGELFLTNGSSALRGALVATVTGERRLRTRALLRAINNSAIALGALGAGVALHYNDRIAYVTLIMVDAATCIAVGLMVLRLPNPRSSSSVDGGRPARRQRVRLVVIRDWRYMLMVAISSVMSIHTILLQVAVPIWVVYNTSAPRWSVSLLFLLNTAACALFQVRVSKYAEGMTAAVRTILTSGFLLFAACILIGFSAKFSAWACVLLLVTGGAFHACGEMLQQAGSWTLSFDMARPDYPGQYQGLYSMTIGIASAVGPIIIVPLISDFRILGWLLVGLLFTVTGAALSWVGHASQHIFESRNQLGEAPTNAPLPEHGGRGRDVPDATGSVGSSCSHAKTREPAAHEHECSGVWAP
jgi:MFS family permease